MIQETEGETTVGTATAVTVRLLRQVGNEDKDKDSEIPQQVQKPQHPLQGGNYRTYHTDWRQVLPTQNLHLQKLTVTIVNNY
jgi:hypothetical protein